ncbi:TauD/TfdA family dioxygenase [Thiotrichales bacterium 19X7-9]|nr:TauD/TfdA family dioxygenase [Thiotrichales bacterium 19X7-9]
MKINKISEIMGIEITEIDLMKVNNTQTIDNLKSLMLKHQIVVFRNQNLTIEEQIHIARKFGPIEPHPLKYNRCDFKEMTLISNLSLENEVIPYPGPPFLLWHSDGCYLKTPPLFSFFYAETAPKSGGKTFFINSTQAYDELNPEIKAKLKGKKAVFGYSHNMMKRCQDKGFNYLIDDEDLREDVTHFIFRNHPITQKKSIFVNWTHTDSIIGLNDQESHYYLNYLYQHCQQNQYIYAHQYLAGDLVVWDNSATIHSGDYLTKLDSPRVMRRVVTKVT